jgi:hypothetical protein
MTTPKRDLSALRGGLNGLRQPAPLVPSPSPPPAPEERPDERSTAAPDEPTTSEPAISEPTTSESTERPQRSSRKPAKREAPPASSGKKPTPVYLAATTKTELERLARAEGATLTEWVLDRLDDFYQELGEVFGPAPARRSPLPPRQRVVRPRTEASSTVQLRLTSDELAAIEKLRAQLEVPSRSALLARVIELGVERGNRGVG